MKNGTPRVRAAGVGARGASEATAMCDQRSTTTATSATADAARVRELADTFERTGGLGGAGSWRPAFDAWAVDRGLSDGARRAVRIELLRRVVFHATERHVGRAEAHRR